MMSAACPLGGTVALRSTSTRSFSTHKSKNRSTHVPRSSRSRPKKISCLISQNTPDHHFGPGPSFRSARVKTSPSTWPPQASQNLIIAAPHPPSPHTPPAVTILGDPNGAITEGANTEGENVRDIDQSTGGIQGAASDLARKCSLDEHVRPPDGKEDTCDSLSRSPMSHATSSCHLSSLGRSDSLLYMPHMRHQWEVLLKRAGPPQDLPLASDLTWRESEKGRNGARMENWAFRTPKLRRVRMTYFDGGEAGQAFNSLCYPEYGYDLPLLGIDLLAFGANKVLCVVDFQPINDEECQNRYFSPMAPIYERFQDLSSIMTSKYFDNAHFFSPHIILYRSDEGSGDKNLMEPSGRFFQLFDEYLHLYLDLLEASPSDLRPTSMRHVAQGQAAYDKYSAERDPAIKMLSNYFGKEWTTRWAHEFLFPLAPPPT